MQMSQSSGNCILLLGKQFRESESREGFREDGNRTNNPPEALRYVFLIFYLFKGVLQDLYVYFVEPLHSRSMGYLAVRLLSIALRDIAGKKKVKKFLW